MFVNEALNGLAGRRNFVFARHVEGAMEDLNPNLGRRHAFDRFADHTGNRALGLRLIVVSGRRVYAGYHSIIILP